MKNLLLGLSLLVPSIAFSQIESDRLEYYLMEEKFTLPSDRKHSLNLYSDFALNSSAITNDFVKALLYRGYVSTADKDQVSDRLKSTNRFGFDFTGGLTYKYKLKEELTLVTGLYQRAFFGAKFTGDAFELTFRGNSMYAGKTAELSDTRITYLDYQSLSVGAVKKLNDKLSAGVGISFLRGGRYNSLAFDEGSVYTAPDGSYLDFTMDFNLSFSESENLLSSNGMGAGLNLFLNLQQEKSNLSIEVRDLGVMSWKNINSYEGNSTYRYDGADVDDILNFSDSVFVETKADSIAKDLGVEKVQQSVASFVPAIVSVSYQYDLSEKWDIAAGLKYIIHPSYIPRISVKGLYHLKENFLLVPAIAYGGFGRLDLEVGTAVSSKAGWMFSANLFLLEYVAIPKKSSGHGVSLSLTKLL